MYWIHILWAFVLLVSSYKEEPSSKNFLTDDELKRLGHELFFDADLSASGKISCSTCHNPELAYTDGYRKSVNAYGDQLEKNTPSILNLSDNKYFNWSHTATSLYDQLDGPLGNKHPEEMGFYRNQAKITNRLKSKNAYRDILNNRKEVALDEELIRCALVAYVEDLECRKSHYDLSLIGASRLSLRQRIGKNLFFSQKYNCVGCHGGVDFDEKSNSNSIVVLNNYLLDFKVPTLRNVSLTSPYWHDGRTAKLVDAINLHFIEKMIPDSEMSSLIAFLEALADTSYLNNSYYNTPNDAI